VFGFNVYMLGTNARAALFSGINSIRVLVRTYWLAGLLAGIGGIIFLAARIRPSRTTARRSSCSRC
jgi:simple sugar transport system permease protein